MKLLPYTDFFVESSCSNALLKAHIAPVTLTRKLLINQSLNNSAPLLKFTVWAFHEAALEKDYNTMILTLSAFQLV